MSSAVLVLQEPNSDPKDLIALRSVLSALSMDWSLVNSEQAALDSLQQPAAGSKLSNPLVLQSIRAIVVLPTVPSPKQRTEEATSAALVLSSSTQDALRSIASMAPSLFRVVFSANLALPLNPAARLKLAKSGAHMVSHVPSDISRELQALRDETLTGTLECPLCHKQGLTHAELWRHLPQYHINEKNVSLSKAPCPLCQVANKEALLPHFVESHPPPGTVNAHAPRSFLPFVSFGLCVIQRKSDQKFLVVQEYSNQGYWLPGGGIDSGEFPSVAAKRECLEEAGLEVELTGLLRVEFSNCRTHGRMRYIFYGHPKSESDPCKTFPDYESYGACWVSLDDFKNPEMKWRGSEPSEWFNYVAAGGHIAPISILDREGAPPEMPSR